VITKPHERGGHSPRWAAERQKNGGKTKRCMSNLIMFNTCPLQTLLYVKMKHLQKFNDFLEEENW
jgi:hypothetical protein